MALFYVAVRIDAVSLLRFPFLSHIQIFLCSISLIMVIMIINNNYDEKMKMKKKINE